MACSRERVCDAFELMGASFLLDAHDMGSCLFFWHKVIIMGPMPDGTTMMMMNHH